MKGVRKTSKMFSKITSMFHSPNEQKRMQHRFISHWKYVTNFFMDSKDHHISVDQTSLPYHLDQMIQILVEEENESETGLTGPCLEYLLHHKALDTLYSIAHSDCPPGMKQVVLQFFTKILSRIKQPILPHVNVYKPVQRLVCLCGEVSASPAEQEEVQFICVLCAKLKANPYLVNFFIQTTSSPVHINSDGDSKPACVTDKMPHFKILQSLLSLMASNDSWVSVKACEAMMLCASLPEPSAIKCLSSSQFVDYITSKLCTLYSNLPKVMDPANVECIHAKWGWDFLCDTEDEVTFPGKRQLISFMSWLDYCDQLVGISQSDVGQLLAHSICKHFLQELLQPAILQTSELGAITATSQLCQCIQLISSTLLLDEFVSFILGHPSTSNQNSSEYQIRDRLIDRCNHLCEELSITTLKLFEVLLTKQHHLILDTLVLQFLVNRSYIDLEKLQDKTITTLPVTEQRVNDDESQPPSSPILDRPTDQTLCATNKSSMPPSPPVITDQSPGGDLVMSNSQSESLSPVVADQFPECSSGTNDCLSQNKSPLTIQRSPILSPVVLDDLSKPVSPVIAEHSQAPLVITDQSHAASDVMRDDLADQPSLDMDHSPVTTLSETCLVSQLRVHAIVNSFLSILEEDCQSSCQLDDTGYETYLREAHRQFVTVAAHCQQYYWPEEPMGSPKPEQQFDEGPFLKMLLDRISHMLDQSYDINLHVTSLISRLALIPHPNLHEYLLDPMLPVNTSCRTLYKLLEKVALVIKTRVKPIPDYHRKLITIRKQLIGFSDTYRRRSVGEENQCLENANALTGVIILEEFCKELAAIAFVKYHELAVEH